MHEALVFDYQRKSTVRACPVRGIEDKCLLVIGHPTRLSSNIHAGDLVDVRGCREMGYSLIAPALGKEVNVSAESRRLKNSAQGSFSTEVLCCASQFLLVAHSQGEGL